MRNSGQEDIVVGTPIANRTRVETEPLIGFFVNMLALRTDFSGDPTFRELLSRVRETALGAFAHQDLPFEKLVEELQIQRDLSREPLFQVVFALLNAPMPPLELPGLSLTPVAIESGVAKFDLTLSMGEGPDGLTGILEYNTDLFEAEAIRGMTAHFLRLLEVVTAEPDVRVSRASLLTDREHRELLVGKNRTSAALSDVRAHHAFEEQAARVPDRTAVTDSNRQLTYRELNEQANRLARYLQSTGIGPDTIVGIYLNRSTDLIVALLAVLKAGGAYLPLDATSPIDRIVYMLADARVPVLLTEGTLVERLAAGLPQRLGNIMCLDRDANLWRHESSSNISSNVSSDNLAYVIYTSGSTGQPKGVAVPHAGLMNLISWHQHEYSVTPEDRGTQLAGLSFDASVWEIWPYLASGASLHLAPEDVRFDPSQLKQWLVDQEITLTFLPTPLAETVLREPWPAGTALRCLLIGGDRLHRGPSRDIEFTVVNHYGPTENTVVTTCGLVEEGAVSPPIGGPVANTRVYVLDSAMEPVPTGVPGELYIGGVQLARGYLHRPDWTAERFVPDPFSDAIGARLYRTGDRVRWKSSGAIEFLGRMDQQVKIRGYRIELGEIDSVLAQHPSLKEAIVVAREDSPDRRLIAYVVPLSAGEGAASTFSVSELQQFLTTKLPDYMVPSAFVTLEALPLTTSGKVDYRALPAPDRMRPELDVAFVAPQTEFEQRLAGIWANVLGIEKVGAHDNFFALGGDSILTIQIVAQAKQAGLRLAPRQIFQHQTIAELAQAVESAPAIEAEQGLVSGAAPLTPIQNWFFEQQLPDSHHFNQSLLLQIRRPVNAGRLKEAIRQLMLHHDALRLRFMPDQNGWHAVHSEPDENVPFVHFAVPGFTRDEDITTLETRAAELQQSLDLTNGPVLRCALFQSNNGEAARLLIIIHHLVVDGISWRVLLEDLQTAYGQLERGRDVSLPAKTVSWQAWSQRIVEYAASNAVLAQADFWLSPDRCEVRPLPVDVERGDNIVGMAETLTSSLSSEDTRALLTEVPKAYHTQINDALLAALAVAIGEWSGADSILVDLEGHGREEIGEPLDVSRTVGWFTSLFPVALKVSRGEAPGQVLKSVKEQLRAVPHQGIGYGLLRYQSADSDLARQLAALPQAEVSFNYLGQVDQLLAGMTLIGVAREGAGPARSPRARRRHLLEVNAIVVEGRLQVSWTYGRLIHLRDTVQQLAERYADALRVFIQHCLSPGAGGFTASDFPAAKLSQQDLERFLTKIGSKAGAK
jgi:amino acid adenylation domain-containing protein/non-ribosomal peptide synthase protein (TIGR01720 family)